MPSRRWRKSLVTSPWKALPPPPRLARRPKKAQYLRAAEAGDGVVEQMRVKPLQRRRIAEHHVAGILALARAPVIRKRQRAANFLVHGMKVAHQLIAYRRPIGLQLAIKERLSCDYVAERGKAVFLTLVRHTCGIHLPREPLAPVEGDVDEKWKPALEP